MHETGEIVVHVGNAPGPAGDVFGDYFALGDDGVLRAVNRHAIVDAAEKLVRLKVDAESHPRDIAAHITALEPDSDVVIYIVFVRNEGGPEIGIAEAVGGSMHESRIRRSHHHPELVRRTGGGLAVLHDVERVRIGATRRAGAGGGGQVRAGHIKLDDAGSRLTGNGT